MATQTSFAGPDLDPHNATANAGMFDGMTHGFDAAMLYEPFPTIDDYMAEFHRDVDMAAASNATWTMGELVESGIVDQEESYERRQDIRFSGGPWCDLDSNAIHPLFQWEPGKWMYKTDIGTYAPLPMLVWDVFVPAWALATKQLTTSSSLGDFWSVLAAGKFPNDTTGDWTIEWPEGTREDQQCTRDAVLAALATRIKFCFGPAASAWGFCSQVFSPWGSGSEPERLTHPLLEGSATHWPYIELSDRYLNTAMSWLGLRIVGRHIPLPAPTTQQIIRCNLLLSVTICHEISHALTGQRCNEPAGSVVYGASANGETNEPGHPLRPQLSGHVRIREMGSVWEDITFSFRMHDLATAYVGDHPCDHNEHTCVCFGVGLCGLIADCSAEYGSSTQMEVARKFLPLPMSWIKQWFLKSFWENLESNHVHSHHGLDTNAPESRWIQDRDGKHHIWRNECYMELRREHGDPWELAETAEFSLSMYTLDDPHSFIEPELTPSLASLDLQPVFQEYSVR